MFFKNLVTEMKTGDSAYYKISDNDTSNHLDMTLYHVILSLSYFSSVILFLTKSNKFIGKWVNISLLCGLDL